MASEYAKVREQFGRVIGMFQAVKHHAADMFVATQLATAATWDAARTEPGTPEVRARRRRRRDARRCPRS